MEKNINKTKPGQTRLHSIDMNNYVRPDLNIFNYNLGDYILNGEDNSYYKFVDDRYYGSSTNKAVIDSYVNYIYGEGLLNNGQKIKDIMSNNDLRLMIQDYKTQAQCAVQVFYDSNRKVAKMIQIPIKCIGVKRQEDMFELPDFYWYSFDWENRTRFVPVSIPRFGTSSESTELLVIRNPSNLPYFSLPDYQPGLQYCQWEEEFSNYAISHIMNGFSAGHIINIVKGLEGDEESQEIADRAIRSQLTGSRNAGKFFLSFNDNSESKTTIESIQISDAHKQYEFLTGEARDKILMAHKVVNPILFGVDKGSGFSNNADEMVVALKTLYRSQINPIREQLIDGLESVLKLNDPNVNLEFKDFDELIVKTEEEVVVTDNEQTEIITE